MTLPILVGMKWKKTFKINKTHIYGTDAQTRYVKVKMASLGMFESGKVTNGYDFILTQNGIQVQCKVIHLDIPNSNGTLVIPANFVVNEDVEYIVYWGSPFVIVNDCPFDTFINGYYPLNTSPTSAILDMTPVRDTLSPSWGDGATPWNANQLVSGDFDKGLKYDGTWVDGYSSKLLGGTVGGLSDVGLLSVGMDFIMTDATGHNVLVSSNPSTGIMWLTHITNGVTDANWLYFNGHLTDITSEVPFQRNVKYSAFITFDSVNRIGKLYLNGICVKTVTDIANSPGPAFGQWFVGTDITRHFPSWVKYDQITFWREVLDPDTIKTLSDNTIDYDNYFTFDATYRAASTAQSKNQSFKNKSFKNITFKNKAFRYRLIKD